MSQAKVAIICGHGSLPEEVAASCQQQGRDYVLLAFEGHSDQSLMEQHPHQWFKVGQVGSIFKFCRSQSVQQIAMAGRFHRVSWSSIKPDAKGALWLAKLIKKSFGDDSFIRTIIQLIEGEGFEVVSPDSLVGDCLLSHHGVMGMHYPDEQALQDVDRGVAVIEALGRVDVGQATVIQQGMVLGVEALEGTNDLIKRCGVLKREGLGGILVKFTKPSQETRADRPTIGIDTLKNALKAGLRGIALEAGEVIMLDKQNLIAYADKNNLFLVGVTRK